MIARITHFTIKAVAILDLNAGRFLVPVPLYPSLPMPRTRHKIGIRTITGMPSDVRNSVRLFSAKFSVTIQFANKSIPKTCFTKILSSNTTTSVIWVNPTPHQPQNSKTNSLRLLGLYHNNFHIFSENINININYK